MNGKFLYIRYFDILNDDCKYIGTLGVTQDITEIKNLEETKKIN